jgi:gas vesicle protein
LLDELFFDRHDRGEMEMFNQNKDNPVWMMIIPYVIGALIGATVALLLAPQSGKDTLHMIRDKGEDIKDKTVGAIEDTRSRAGKAIDELTQQTKGNLSSMTHGRG